MSHPPPAAARTESAPFGVHPVAVYRQTDLGWTRINALRPPSQRTQVKSAEPFVHNGRSYGVRESEVWIAAIDPDQRFYRRVSTPGGVGLHRGDPEPLVAQAGPVIYYWGRDLTGPRMMLKAATRLAPPQ